MWVRLIAPSRSTFWNEIDGATANLVRECRSRRKGSAREGVPRPAQLSAERGHGPSTSRSDAATCFIMTAKIAIITLID